MRRWRMVLPLAALAFAGPMAAGAQEKAPAASPAKQTVRQMISVEKTQIDMGKVLAGDEVVATFVFHNSGDRPVKILRAKPT